MSDDRGYFRALLAVTVTAGLLSVVFHVVHPDENLSPAGVVVVLVVLGCIGTAVRLSK